MKSGRSPPDPHVPPYAYYELGVLYAQDSKVRFDWLLVVNNTCSEFDWLRVLVKF